MKIYLLFFFVFILCNCSEKRSDLDTFNDNLLIKFAKQMEKEGLYAAGIGGGCTIEKKINLLSITFNIKKTLNIDESRTLIVKSTQKLLKIIDEDARSKFYFEKFPVTVEIFNTCIMGEIPLEGNPMLIEVVKLFHGKVIYKNIDRTDGIWRSIYVREESFDEAQKILNQELNTTDSY